MTRNIFALLDSRKYTTFTKHSFSNFIEIELLNILRITNIISYNVTNSKNVLQNYYFNIILEFIPINVCRKKNPNLPTYTLKSRNNKWGPASISCLKTQGKLTLLS